MELLGLFLPLLIDTITIRLTDAKQRFWVSFLVCAIVGVFLNWLDTNLHFVNQKEGFESISKSVMTVFGLSQLTFNAYWENSNTRTNMLKQLK